MINRVHTSPGLHHVNDDVVDEADLRARDGAGRAVEHGHHHRQVLSLLLVCLQEVLLCDPGNDDNIIEEAIEDPYCW